MTAAVTDVVEESDLPYPQALAAILFGLAVLRMLALTFNQTDLFFDEAQYWTWSLEPSFGYYSKPPLIAWAIAAATHVCGSSEACIRLPAPIFHTIAAVGLYLCGARLFDRRTGFWAAVAYATLPAVSLSSGIISTDVPLLACWAFALWSLVALRDTARWWPGIVLGVSIGLGLNAKYAMAYFVLCTAVFLVIVPEQRRLLRDRRLWFALALGLAMIGPNLVWNARHGFATFAHTADNAKWSGSLVHPDKAAEFIISQFGVFGPILFGVLLVISWRSWRQKMAESDRFLLAFSLPILAIVTVQAFLSRANANWAAPAFMSATVLVIATMLREGAWGWLKASFGLHIVMLVLFISGTAFAGRFALPGVGDPFKRTVGWRAVAIAARQELERARTQGHPFAALITDERALTAELLYYSQNEATPVLAWWHGGRPRDHYELTRPFTAASPTPVLLVALRSSAQDVASQFEDVEKVGEEDVKAGQSSRHLVFFRLGHLKGR